MKSTGDPRTLGQLRADVAASLLTGRADIIDCSAPTDTHTHTEQDQPQPEPERDHAEQDESEQADTEQDEADRAEREAEQTPGGQGHCAVHQYPDHDLHRADCDCD